MQVRHHQVEEIERLLPNQMVLSARGAVTADSAATKRSLTCKKISRRLTPLGVLLTAHIMNIVVFGFSNNVGALNYIWMKEFDLSVGTVAWVGSANIGMVYAIGPFASALCNKLGCSFTGFIGCLLGAVGILLSTLAESQVYLIIFYSITYGVGASLVFFSSVIILSNYYDSKLPIAIGIVTAGSGVGTLVFTSFVNSYYNFFGWRMGLRIYAALLITLSILQFIYSDSKKSKSLRNKSLHHMERGNHVMMKNCIWFQTAGKELCPLSHLTNISYLLFMFSCFMFMLASFVPYLFLARFAMVLGVDIVKARLLVGYLCASSIIGRLITSKVAAIPRVPRLLLMNIAFLFTAISHIMVAFSTNYYHLLAYSIVVGFFEGAFNSLISAIVCEFLGRSNLGSGMGLLFGLVSLSLTLGGPLAGFLYNRFGNFKVVFIASGTFGLFGMLFLLIIAVINIIKEKKRSTLAMSNQLSLLINPSVGENSHDNPEIISISFNPIPSEDLQYGSAQSWGHSNDHEHNGL